MDIARFRHARRGLLRPSQVQYRPAALWLIADRLAIRVGRRRPRRPPPLTECWCVPPEHDADSGQGCVWQLGGPFIPGTINTFGGTSAAEYGPLLSLFYPQFPTSTTTLGPTFRYNDFRNILSSNPCPNTSQNGQ